MGCFLACFGTKEKKRQKPAIKTLPRSRSHGSYGSLPQTCSPGQQTTEERHIDSFPVSRDKPEKLSLSSRKIVEFDLNIKSLPQTSPKQQTIETQIDSFPVSRDKPEELSLASRKKVAFDLNVKSYSKVSVDDELNSTSEKDLKEESDHEEGIRKGAESLTSSGDSSSTSNTSSYPPTHRYQNCRCSDDEDGDDEYEDEEEEDDDYDGGEEEDEESFDSEESFESYSSTIESEKRISVAPDAKQENNTTSICSSLEDPKSMLPISLNARDRSQYVHSVLNPVENLSQWKALKHKDAQRTPLKQYRKENSISEQEMQIPFSSEPSFKLPKSQIPINSDQGFKLPKPDKKQEISVDASLSNWLIPSEATINKCGETQFDLPETNKYQSMSARKNSPRTHDDRPILGALTVEEINWASPRRSPKRSPSPDEVPILGTVGTYWNHINQDMDSSPQRSGSEIKGIPNTTSKYKEDKRVNWHSTPFEVRLERALRGDSFIDESSSINQWRC